MHKLEGWLIRGSLPLILAAAVLQGWSLYGLHHAIQSQQWPATAPGILLGLYAIAMFVPLTIQLLADHARARAAWAFIATIGIAFFYFGWHTGTAVMDSASERFVSSGEWFPLAFVLCVLWLMILPFVQARLIDGHWRARYELLFWRAWNNKLVLGEAALFTGLFWLLLILWGQLFDMIGIGFFEELFEEPVFVYPVTSLVFGTALHLIGSIERLTGVILEQVLSVLKWLALLAGLILTLFTVALAMKLPGMISSGQRVIAAHWLLWLVAVTVLLINAAYRDGAVERPYPRGIALLLRFAVPLTTIISLTAVYALYLRIERYGFTVERVWACVVAAAASVYSVGYAIACRLPTPWMRDIARINVIAAWFLIAVLSLAMTPVLSPYRIAANSQFELAKEEPSAETEPGASTQRGNATPMRYLRYSAGQYGKKRLEELAHLQDHPRAEEIRTDAAAVLKEERFGAPLPTEVTHRLAGMVIHPRERTIEPPLKERLEADLRDPALAYRFHRKGPLIGAFINLDQNEGEEFVIIAGATATVYQLQASGWRRAAYLTSQQHVENSQILRFIEQAGLSAQPSIWKELRIGNSVYRYSGETN